MGKLLKEAALDDRFNTQMDRVEGAINNLREILKAMKSSGGMTNITSTQKMMLRHAAEDFKRLHDEA